MMNQLACLAFVLGGCSSSESAAPSTSDSALVDSTADSPIEASSDTEQDGSRKTDNPFILSTGIFAAGTTNLLFFNYAAEAGGRCAAVEQGACWILDCAGTGAAPAGVSAGTITLSKASGEILTSKPEASGRYPASFVGSQEWEAGDALTIAATGAAVPAFSVSLTGPTQIAATDPPTTIKRAEDLTIHWTAATGKVGVWASQVPSSADLSTSTRFLCSFDASAGVGVVPSAVVSVLKAGKTTNLNVGGVVEKTVDAGGYAIHAFAIDALTTMVSVE